MGSKASSKARFNKAGANKAGSKAKRQADVTEVMTPLRIIGGKFRGRKLEYSGRIDTRPMKHRVREAIFNLVGPGIKGQHAVDLFAGTGALGLEAISRGAVSATLIERHFPTADVIQKNVVSLDVEPICEVTVANTFLWGRKIPLSESRPWVVFCSPPYDFYVERSEEMRQLIENIIQAAPNGSTIVIEADQRFDVELLPSPSDWDVRTYAPSVVGIRRLDSDKSEGAGDENSDVSDDLRPEFL